MQHTACHEWHVSQGGRMVDFAGWEMPVQYSTIVDEHNAVRNAAGMFDIAHMGRLFFSGPDACRFRTALSMVAQMDDEAFGSCTNTSECEAACPAAISVTNIARLNREYMKAMVCSK